VIDEWCATRLDLIEKLRQENNIVLAKINGLEATHADRTIKLQSVEAELAINTVMLKELKAKLRTLKKALKKELAVKDKMTHTAQLCCSITKETLMCESRG
jgi:hypothetical protein